MKTLFNYILLFLIGLTGTLLFCFSCHSQNQNPVPFRIEIINMYMGHVNYKTSVTNDSLVIFHDDFGKNITTTERNLTEKEKKNLQEFIRDFPLQTLDNRYENPQVEDGIQIDFKIKINDLSKDIYISNKYQKDLGELVKEVVKLLPEDYIGFNERSFNY